MNPLRFAAAVLALAATAPLATAQSLTVDEGTLLITRNGTPVGREAFRVVKAPAGSEQAFQATITTAIDSQQITLRLTTGASGEPLTYEAVVRTRGALTARVSGNGRPGRFNTLRRTPHGEAARAFVMGANPLLIDDDVFTPYYFAVLPPLRSQFSTINPRTGTLANFRFQDRGTEPVTVGRRTEQAHHYALITPSGATRDIWVSATGELLRVSIPARGLIAQRDELPQ